VWGGGNNAQGHIYKVRTFQLLCDQPVQYPLTINTRRPANPRLQAVPTTPHAASPRRSAAAPVIQINEEGCGHGAPRSMLARGREQCTRAFAASFAAPSYRIPGRCRIWPSLLVRSKRTYPSATRHINVYIYRSQRRKGRGSWVGGRGSGVGGRGSGVGSGEACARHRRRQRRAAHVIVVDQLVLLQVRLRHSVGPIGVHSASLGRLLDREKPRLEVRELLPDVRELLPDVHLLVRVQLDASHGPHRAGRLSSDATPRWSSDATRPHERHSGRHRKQSNHQKSVVA
jgi:hypothetical protein